MVRYFEKIIVVSVLVVITSCKTRKIESRSKTIQSDTLILKTEVTKAPAITEVLRIKELCDTVTGRVVRFEKVFVQNGDSLRVLTNEKNELEVFFKQREKTIDSLYSEISRYKQLIESHHREEVTKSNFWLRLRDFVLGAAFGVLVMIFRPWRFI